MRPGLWWKNGWMKKKVMYGVTTGFGALCTKAIDKKETAQLQTNIILSHFDICGGAPFRRSGTGHAAYDAPELGTGL